MSAAQKLNIQKSVRDYGNDIPGFYCPVHNPDRKVYPVSPLVTSSTPYIIDGIDVIEPPDDDPDDKEDPDDPGSGTDPDDQGGGSGSGGNTSPNTNTGSNTNSGNNTNSGRNH